jgi:quercetin dioxygenase-like cupin family protein
MTGNARVIDTTNQPVENLPGRTLKWLARYSEGTTASALLENVLPPGGFVPSHRHSVEELLVCIEGEGEVQIDGDSCTFGVGEVVVIPAGKTHGFRNVGGARMHVLAFFPSARPDVAWEDPRHRFSWDGERG